MPDIAHVKELFAAIPAAVWVGLFGTGAAISIFTQWSANRHALRTQKLSLEHDARQRYLERQMSLRREIYLPAVDAITGLMRTLGELTNLSVPDTEIGSRFSDNMATLWRVQMVGGKETIRALSVLQQEIGMLFFESFEARMALSFLKTDRDIAQGIAQEQRSEVNICIELMKEYNLEGRKDEARWKTIQQRSKFAADQRDSHQAQANIAGDTLFASHVTNARTFGEKLGRLTGLWAPAVIAMRVELESSDAAAVLAQEIERNFSAMRVALTKAMDTLEAQYHSASHSDEEEAMA